MAFLNLMFILIIAFVVLTALYYLVIHIIKQWTGCDNAEAEQKLHNLFNGKTLYSFNNDNGFIIDVENTATAFTF